MRRYLTKNERAQMAHDQGHRCGCGCDQPLGERTIGEHWIMVAWGNEDKPDTLLRFDCAKDKTRRDVKAIAKVKRIVKRLDGTRRERKPILSPGFSKTLRKRLDGSVVTRT